MNPKLVRLPRSSSPLASRVLSIFVAAIGLLLLGLVVFPFLEPFGWALVVTISAWPIFRSLQTKAGLSRTFASVVITLLLTLALILAVVPVSFRLIQEATTAIEHANFDAASLRDRAAQVPYVGGTLSGMLTSKAKPEQAMQSAGPIAKVAMVLVQTVSHTLFILGVAIFLSFFLFLHGSELARQARVIVLRLGGPPVAQLLTTAYDSVLATVYGTLVTAIAQGVLAGAGYAVAGAPVPILLGVATLVFSLLPFGAPAVYVPVAAYLAFGIDRWEAGLALLIWGIVVVSVIDNVLRPVFISRSSEMSIALVFVGIVGGALAFGPLGIFLGPTIMALARVAWIDLVPKWIPETKVDQKIAGNTN